MKDKTLLKNLVIILGLVACLAVFYATGRWVEDSRALKSSKQEDKAFQEAFSAVEVHAQSAFAFDLSKGKTFYAKAENDKQPIASLTKIMTALTVLDKLNEESVVIMPDGSWRAYDLIKFMLISSSNDAAMALFATHPGALVED